MLFLRAHDEVPHRLNPQVHSAIGITLPKPEQEKAVAIIWVVAAVMLVVIILATGWLVVSSMSSSVTYR